ncbi:lipopolysaccharide biosynthesis protein [Paucihalobacter sp.]|uniref:lipopolysaccharide biosynthesis protein n=1 Tax=Paucihalobacter sp. TaxID=2850405 RepID=UPI002FE13ED2
MLKKLKSNKKYLVYGLSIIFSRGLEYFVLFYAAKYLSKQDYGTLEFYKKIIELGAVALAFGLPSLLLSYTRSVGSKINLTFLSFLFISALALAVAPVLYYFNYQFLLVPILFHAVFFNNGILPVYFITNRGSTAAAIYKSVISIVFYSIVFTILLVSENKSLAFVNVNYFILPLGLLYLFKVFWNADISKRFLWKYFKLFQKLLLSSLTLVLSNFANIMFLYTDILIIELISSNSKVDIADYSFALNLCNMLILIPLTMVQVEIETIKKTKMVNALNSKILKNITMFAVVVIIGYLFLINTFYQNFQSTLWLFFVILVAKVFQAHGVLLGSYLLVIKKFRLNLYINIFALFFNIIASILLFKFFGLIGIALASILSLSVRYALLRYFSNYFGAK